MLYLSKIHWTNNIHFDANHLYYADDLVLIASSSYGMQKSITEWESFANKHGLKLNEMKSVIFLTSCFQTECVFDDQLK